MTSFLLRPLLTRLRLSTPTACRVDCDADRPRAGHPTPSSLWEKQQQQLESAAPSTGAPEGPICQVLFTSSSSNIFLKKWYPLYYIIFKIVCQAFFSVENKIKKWYPLYYIILYQICQAFFSLKIIEKRYWLSPMKVV